MIVMMTPFFPKKAQEDNHDFTLHDRLHARSKKLATALRHSLNIDRF